MVCFRGQISRFLISRSPLDQEFPFFQGQILSVACSGLVLSHCFPHHCNPKLYLEQKKWRPCLTGWALAFAWPCFVSQVFELMLMKLDLFQCSRGAMALCLLSPASSLWCSGRLFCLERKGSWAHQLLIVHQSLLSTWCVKSAARSLRIPLEIAHRDVVGEFKVPLAPSVMGTVSKSQNSCILPEVAPGFRLQLFPALPQLSFDAVQCVQTTLLLCFFSRRERVFWQHVAWLCWLESTQDWFTPAGLPGCVCLALNKAGCDVCLESTWGHLIHVFLLWLTTKFHLLLSTTNPP